ncbi:MAG TPA: acyl-CoA dehydrogenase family protein, partial [Bdellovibrio sp.]|nr:acyl-CoA dehydrogenase family protein [Bdellovibrio sp.]
NSICAVGHMRRALDLAQDYSRKRQAFGKLLIDHPLHRETLRWLESDFRHCFAFSFYVAHLLGKEEVGEISASERTMLRTLTPVLKLYTGKKALSISSEVVEIFGGAGYVEDTGLTRLLRDGQVFSIWEGTTNVLSLDMLRAFQKEQSLPVIMEFLKNSGAAKAAIPSFTEKWTAFQKLVGRLTQPSSKEEDWEVHARQLSLTLGDLMGEALAFEYEL